MFATRSRPLRLVRITLSLAVIIGVAGSIGYSRQLAQLRRTYAKLRTQAGELEVDDPTKVAICPMPFLDDDIPPGVDQAYVWRYRVHIPADYGPAFRTQRGLVTADSPQGRGSSGGSWGGSNMESEELLMTMALIHSDGKWRFCRSSGGSSSAGVLPDDFKIESIDDLVIDVPVPADVGTRVFDTDEAICLIRIREKNLAKKRNGKTEENLYRGFVVYMHSNEYKDAFEAWAKGAADSMQEARP
ncbi:hypothetical protein [Novipirellula maiorica]|uniref:hypothetical protein n=1 Tax=Novipirellula maiorica TaxID=1265734 RepID=UPI00034D2C38|nr:hypothetical protein [Rhodopirellula maiorica]